MNRTFTTGSGSAITSPVGEIAGITWTRNRKPAPIYTAPDKESRFEPGHNGTLIFENVVRDAAEPFDIQINPADDGEFGFFYPLQITLIGVQLVTNRAEVFTGTPKPISVYNFWAEKCRYYCEKEE